MTVRRFAVAAALLASGALSAGFLRTTSETTGVALSWQVPVVGYHVNPTIDPLRPNSAPSCDPTGTADPAIAAIRASFAEWEEPCADLRFVYGGTFDEIRTGIGGIDENVVVFRRGWCSENAAAVADPCFQDPSASCGGIYDCFEDTGRYAGHSIVALTSVLYDPRTGRIFGADIELNGWDGTEPGSTLSTATHGWYFSCLDPAVVPTTTICTNYGDDGCHYIDLRNTVTHEVGHFLGLAHPCGEPGLPPCSVSVPAPGTPYSQRTMNPQTAPGEVSKRSLSADDVAGVCAIYANPSGGCGCGRGEGAGAGSLLVAALALRRRRATGRPC